MEEVAVSASQYLMQGNQLCSGRVAGSLFDPFGFVHKASSGADPGTVKEIVSLIHEFLLFFRRQILEHDLIVQVCQRCAFGKGKELGSELFIPQLIDLPKQIMLTI